MKKMLLVAVAVAVTCVGASSPAHAWLREPTDLLKDCRFPEIDATDQFTYADFVAEHLNRCLRDPEKKIDTGGETVEAKVLRGGGVLLELNISGHQGCDHQWLKESLNLSISNGNGAVRGVPAKVVDDTTIGEVQACPRSAQTSYPPSPVFVCDEGLGGKTDIVASQDVATGKLIYRVRRGPSHNSPEGSYDDIGALRPDQHRYETSRYIVLFDGPKATITSKRDTMDVAHCTVLAN